MVEECPASDKYPIPLNIAAAHYSNTVCMLLQKGFLTAEPVSKEDALGCLDYLLGTLEREGGNV